MLGLIRKYSKDSLYRNSIILILNSGFNALFGLLFWIVAARTLSSEDIGLSTAALSAAALIVALSRLGLDQGIIRYLPTMEEKSAFYSTVVVLTLVLSLIVTVIFLQGITLFSPALSFLRTGWFLPVFIGYIIISSIYSIQNTTLIAMRRTDLCMVQNILLGARIPLVIILASLGVLGVFSSFEIAFLLTLLFGSFILYRHGLSISKKLDLGSIKKTLIFSLGNYSAGIFTMAPVTIIPIMIVNTIGAKYGAYFYIAYSISGVLLMIPNSISTSLFVEGSHNRPLKASVINSLKLIFICLIPALITIFIFGNKLLSFFSSEYSKESFEMLQLLAVSSIFSSVTSIFISIKKIQKDVSIINYLNFILSLLIIAFGYIALLNYGFLGLGYAWLGVNVLICAVVCLIICNEKWV